MRTLLVKTGMPHPGVSVTLAVAGAGEDVARYLRYKGMLAMTKGRLKSKLVLIPNRALMLDTTYEADLKLSVGADINLRDISLCACCQVDHLLIQPPKNASS